MSRKVSVSDLIEFIRDVDGHYQHPTVAHWKYITWMAFELTKNSRDKDAIRENSDIPDTPSLEDVLGQAAPFSFEDLMAKIEDLTLELVKSPAEGEVEDGGSPEEEHTLSATQLDDLWVNSVLAQPLPEGVEIKEKDLEPRFVLCYAKEGDQTPIHVWACAGEDEEYALLQEVKNLYGKTIVASDYREGRKPEPMVYSYHRSLHNVFPPMNMVMEVLFSEPQKKGPLGGIIPSVYPWEMDRFRKQGFEDVDAMKVPKITFYSLGLEGGNLKINKLS